MRNFGKPFVLTPETFDTGLRVTRNFGAAFGLVITSLGVLFNDGLLPARPFFVFGVPCNPVAITPPENALPDAPSNAPDAPPPSRFEIIES